jgi:hypothetical protein
VLLIIVVVVDVDLSVDGEVIRFVVAIANMCKAYHLGRIPL